MEPQRNEPEGEVVDDSLWRPRIGICLQALARVVSGPPTPNRYRLVRTLITRLLGVIYIATFAGAVLQIVPLIGENGLLPVDLYLSQVHGAVGDGAWFELPTVFWWDHSDTALLTISSIGLVLGCLLLIGIESAPVLLLLWLIQLSLLHVGQRFYSFGWETQLLETTLLTALMCSWTRFRPSAMGADDPPRIAIVLMRWLAFRIMLGAGLIKLRGDPCWTDLTCLEFHFETQPNPHPGSWLFHQFPAWVHRGGVLFNHLAEVVLAFFVFGPRRLRNITGVVLVLFQATLIISGNLSFLNWLTIVPCLACFDDQFLSKVVPERWRARLELDGAPSTPARARSLLAWGFAILVAFRSIEVVGNLLSPEQAMNRSFDRLHLVNTYGAFGSITRERFELIIEGTSATRIDEHTRWEAYEFPCKPGDPARRPCWITPYHLRADWLMWFAALEVQGSGALRRDEWVVHLVYKLLAGDPTVAPLFSHDPFPGVPPQFIRVEVYRYHFANPGADVWWERQRVGTLVRPVAVDSPQLLALLRTRGWLRE